MSTGAEVYLVALQWSRRLRGLQLKYRVLLVGRPARDAKRMLIRRKVIWRSGWGHWLSRGTKPWSTRHVDWHGRAFGMDICDASTAGSYNVHCWNDGKATKALSGSVPYVRKPDTSYCTGYLRTKIMIELSISLPEVAVTALHDALE